MKNVSTQKQWTLVLAGLVIASALGAAALLSGQRLASSKTVTGDERAEAAEPSSLALSAGAQAESASISPKRDSSIEPQPAPRGTAATGAPHVRAKSPVREAARTYREGKENAFFDETAFIKAFGAEGKQNIDAIRDELRHTEQIAALPSDVRFMADAPEEVLERMAMIDLLGESSKESPEAVKALVEIAMSPLDASLPPQAIQVIVGEKFDAFVELARHNWTTAVSTFSLLQNEAIKQAMRPALIGGLLDIGTPREEALRMVEAI